MRSAAPSRRNPYPAPAPELIRSTRLAAGLTQPAAAAMVCTVTERWQEWEYGKHRMPPGLFRLFLILNDMTLATLECLLRAELLDMPDAERVALLARLFRGICRDCGSQRLPCGCAATK